jgi:hypothetical protein
MGTARYTRSGFGVGVLAIVMGLEIGLVGYGHAYGRVVDWGPYHGLVGGYFILWGLGFIYLAVRRRNRNRA